jgi:FkbM family methyltransferase
MVPSGRISAHLGRLTNWLRGRISKGHPAYTTIGGYRIRLAPKSKWPVYRSNFTLYDTALAEISQVLGVKFPALCAIDIGANVGDTAALIRQYAEIPVLCIEGDRDVLPVLRENAAVLGRGVVIHESFVGSDDVTVNPALITDAGRNASLAQAAEPEGSVRLRSLEAILGEHPEFADAKLLKVDTEGFDFAIIAQSIDFITRAKPVILFEYDPHYHPEKTDSGIEMVHRLIDAGYSDFIYYDNFGNFLLHADARDTSTFRDLDLYLGSNRKHGIAVYYFDICAIHRDDRDLIPSIRSRTQK